MTDSQGHPTGNLLVSHSWQLTELYLDSQVRRYPEVVSHERTSM